MLKSYLNLIAAFCVFISYAQVPQKFSYQMVARSSDNQLIVNKMISLKITLHQTIESGLIVYSEIHQPTTNSNGLASVAIGGGVNLSGDFAKIDWSKGPYFIKTETDLSGGSNYTLTSISQLLSVPYALYAGNGIKKISNNRDTVYLSNQEFFTVNSSSGNSNGSIIKPSINLSVDDISSNSAEFNLSVKSDISNQLSNKVVLYVSTKPNPNQFYSDFSLSLDLMNGSVKLKNEDSLMFSERDYWYVVNNFDDRKIKLSPNTKYYVRASVTSENAQCFFSNEISFSTLTVGQKGVGGGTIFYDRGKYVNGWRYLEASNNDLSSSASFGCINNIFKDTLLYFPNNLNGLGNGEVNTNNIVKNCLERDNAASLCFNYSTNNATDWYLPSIGELVLIWKNITNSIDFPKSTTYEYISSSVYYIKNYNIPNNTYGTPSISNTNGEQRFYRDLNKKSRVRAVRSY